MMNVCIKQLAVHQELAPIILILNLVIIVTNTKDIVQAVIDGLILVMIPLK